MDINFSTMQVGDHVLMPNTVNWGSANKEVYEAANEYAKSVDGAVQFEFHMEVDNTGKPIEPFWMTRTR